LCFIEHRCFWVFALSAVSHFMTAERVESGNPKGCTLVKPAALRISLHCVGVFAHGRCIRGRFKMDIYKTVIPNCLFCLFPSVILFRGWAGIPHRTHPIGHMGPPRRGEHFVYTKRQNPHRPSAILTVPSFTICLGAKPRIKPDCLSVHYIPEQGCKCPLAGCRKILI